MAALVVYLLVAILLFGSLYMSVGAACNELKDAQSLMMPVMMVSTKVIRIAGFISFHMVKSPYARCKTPSSLSMTQMPGNGAITPPNP